MNKGLFRARLLCVALAAVPLTALADPPAAPAETASSAVPLSDLDLSTPAGLRKAQERLSAAAERLCHKFSDDRKISNSATMTDCYRQTYASALQNLNSKRMTANDNR